MPAGVTATGGKFLAVEVLCPEALPSAGRELVKSVRNIISQPFFARRVDAAPGRGVARNVHDQQLIVVADGAPEAFEDFARRAMGPNDPDRLEMMPPAS